MAVMNQSAIFNLFASTPVAKAMSDADLEAIRRILETTPVGQVGGWYGEQIRKAAAMVKGDYVGHPFRGNQHTDASGISRNGGGAPRAAGGVKSRKAPDAIKDKIMRANGQDGPNNFEYTKIHSVTEIVVNGKVVGYVARKQIFDDVVNARGFAYGKQSMGFEYGIYDKDGNSLGPTVQRTSEGGLYRTAETYGDKETATQKLVEATQESGASSSLSGSKENARDYAEFYVRNMVSRAATDAQSQIVGDLNQVARTVGDLQDKQRDAYLNSERSGTDGDYSDSKRFGDEERALGRAIALGKKLQEQLTAKGFEHLNAIRRAASNETRNPSPSSFDTAAAIVESGVRDLQPLWRSLGKVIAAEQKQVKMGLGSKAAVAALKGMRRTLEATMQQLTDVASEAYSVPAAVDEAEIQFRESGA